ncbi:MAG: PEP-CTERM sorting domain-containing protein [Bryobacteraceae bacterium]
MKKTVLALSACCLNIVSLSADTISTSPAASFANLGSANFLLGGGGTTPFFVNRSGDASYNQGTNRDFSALSNTSANLNLGSFLTGTGNWSGNALSPNLSASNLALETVTGAADGASPANFFFNKTGSTYQMTLLLSLTGNALEFGWYDTANPATLNALYSNTGCNPGGINPCAKGASSDGTAGGATAVSFTPSATYGFYIRFTSTNPATFGYGWTAFTQDSLNTYSGNTYGIGAGAETPLHQHFALLQNVATTNRYYIGVEDGFFGSNCNGNCGIEGQGDYNDFVIQFDIDNVPEPGTVGMMGIGLAALVAFARRRQQ